MRKITITHFVNPQHFYFKYENAASILRLELLEKDVAAYAKKQTTTTTTKLDIGDDVWVYYNPMQTYIRGTIVEVIETNESIFEYIVWANDRGFYIFTKAEYVNLLPMEIGKKFDERFIFRGGLVNIVPANSENTWNVNDCEKMKKLFMNKVLILYVDSKDDKNDMLWCRVFYMNNKKVERNMINALHSCQFAKAVDKEKFAEFKKNIKIDGLLPWFGGADLACYIPNEKSSNEEPQQQDDIIVLHQPMEQQLISIRCLALCDLHDANEELYADFLLLIDDEETVTLEKYALQQLEKGYSIAVHTSKTADGGMKWFYLPFLFEHIKKNVKIYKEWQGPIAMIIVANQTSYNMIGHICKTILVQQDKYIKLRGIKKSSILNERREDLLLNGVHILIIEASKLLEYLDFANKYDIIKSEYLSLIVCDNIEKILSENDEFDINMLQKLLKRLILHTNSNARLVCTGNKWYTELEETYLKYTKYPTLLFTNHLDAAIAAKCYFDFKIYTNADKKMDAIVQFVTQNVTNNFYRRLVVVCTEAKETILISNILNHNGLSAFIYNNVEDIGHDEVQCFKLWQNLRSTQILICTDADIPHLHVTHVQKLIHFSLPANWETFAARFVLLKTDSYNYIKPDECITCTNGGDKQLISFAPIDEFDQVWLQQIINFMEAHDLPLDKQLFDLVEQMDGLDVTA